MNKVEQANRYIDLIRERSSEALLFLSLGKDSLVLLDLLYPKFDRIVCVFMYFVKDLEHINRWINWTKARYPKIEFVQVPHWNLTYILRGGMYCVPNPEVRLLKLADVVKAMQLKHGVYYTKLLQKSEMRKNMVMDLIYRGFIYAANYSESHYNPRRSQIKTELRYLFVTTPNR